MRLFLNLNIVGLVLSLATVALSGCASQTLSGTAVPANGIAPESEEGYTSAIEKFSAGDSEYSGFYNNFQYKATIMNADIRQHLVNKQANYYQWDRTKYLAEKEKSDREAANETRVFLTFFTPDRRTDNLSDVRSIWRIYLDVGGHRYVGKVERVRNLFAELSALYPYHTRWNTPYYAIFPVSTTSVQGQSMTFTVTGPLGTRTVQFPAL